MVMPMRHNLTYEVGDIDVRGSNSNFTFLNFGGAGSEN